MTTKAYLAVDIEKTGPNLIKHPVISIGMVLGDANGNVIAKHKINLLVDWPKDNQYFKFDPRCFTEFWEKNPSAILACRESPEPIEQAAGFKQLNDLLLMYESKYDLVFLTDNASFDIATLDYNLELYCNRAPMRYTSKGKYRSIIAVDDMFSMLKLKFVYNNIHDSVNDALDIYNMYMVVLRHL